MHIQEGTNTTLTTCTKMTEEVDRRHGVNGNSSNKGATDDEHALQHGSSSTHSGGSLKFFKDGKFILELVRGCAREGERAGWVSVPRKTFWPPPAPAPPVHTHTPRQERAASLSVSDDNSSIQSSPWQRDHCWKQSTPRRNISKELTFFYCRPSTLHSSVIEAGARRRRRRPHEPAPEPPRNGLRTNGAHSPPEPDAPEKYHMKLKKPHQYHKLRAYKKTKPTVRPKKLHSTIERLRARVAALPVPVNAKLASCRTQEHAMVSPRKRILRELERGGGVVVAAGEEGKRRARAAASPGPSAAPRAAAAAAPPASKNVSSYSIHSLLSLDAGGRRAPPPPPPPLLYRPPPPPPPPLWLAYAPPHWPPPLAHHHYHHTHLMHNDDNANEMPLNLSKH